MSLAAQQPANIVISPAVEAAMAKTVGRNLGLAAEREFHLTPKQDELYDLIIKGQRHTMAVGGARSAKTFGFVRAVVARAMKAPLSRHAILRFRGNAVWATIGKDTLPKVCRIAFQGPVNITGPHKEGYYLLPNKSEIWLAGLDEKERVEKILGMEFATIFFNECSQIPYDSVITALTRLAQVCRNITQKAFYDLNPTNKRHWSYVLFILKKDPTTGALLDNPDDYAHIYMNPKDNADNLDPAFLAAMAKLPPRKRKRFYDGAYGDDDEGALWSEELIDAGRRTPEQVPALRAVVVAVDPSGAKDAEDEGHDEIGIAVFGLGIDGHGYVLEDLTCLDGPNGWGKRAINAYHRRQADHITGEVNYGGAMVEFVIKSIDAGVPFREVTASRGKVVRAEPAASLYGVIEEGKATDIKIHHVGRFPELEDEMCGFTTLGYIGEGSPNRADALVWAITDLMLNDHAAAWIEHFANLAGKAHEEKPDEKPDIDMLPYRVNRPPTPGAVDGGQLYELYRNTVDQYNKGESSTRCARVGCTLGPVGATRVSDGERVWHVGCS